MTTKEELLAEWYTNTNRCFGYLQIRKSEKKLLLLEILKDGSLKKYLESTREELMKSFSLNKRNKTVSAGKRFEAEQLIKELTKTTPQE